MVLGYQDRRRNVDYKNKFDTNYSVRLYPKIEVHNELFTIKKISIMSVVKKIIGWKSK